MQTLTHDYSNIRDAFLAMKPVQREDFPQIVADLKSAISDCEAATKDLWEPQPRSSVYADFEGFEVSDHLDRLEDALVDAYQTWLQAMYDRGDDHIELVQAHVALTAVDLHVAYAARRWK